MFFLVIHVYGYVYVHLTLLTPFLSPFPSTLHIDLSTLSNLSNQTYILLTSGLCFVFLLPSVIFLLPLNLFFLSYFNLFYVSITHAQLLHFLPTPLPLVVSFPYLSKHCIFYQLSCPSLSTLCSLLFRFPRTPLRLIPSQAAPLPLASRLRGVFAWSLLSHQPI